MIVDDTTAKAAEVMLKEGRESNNGPYPQAASFDHLCYTVKAMAKAGLNPEGFWKVGGSVGYVQKLSGVWNWQDPAQGWRELRP